VGIGNQGESTVSGLGQASTVKAQNFC